MLRLSIADVADHIERFQAVYQQAVHDPADGGVYEALVRHFADYALAFIARCAHPDLPGANHRVMAQFVAHGFAGSIKAWLSDSSTAKGELVERGGGLCTCVVELIAGDPLRKLVVETVPTAEEPGASARKLREVIKESEPCAPVRPRPEVRRKRAHLFGTSRRA